MNTTTNQAQAMEQTQDPASIQTLRKTIMPFARADTSRALWQLGSTLACYLASWAVMIAMLRSGLPFWGLIPFIAAAALLLVRLFTFFHDCCHGSFLRTARANRIAGYVTGILTFTPFESWRRAHLTHHASYADLDKRGVGDIWTMTVAEYSAAPLALRIAYRLFRNPLVFLVLGPAYVFLISQRLPARGDGPAERRGVLLTNLALAGIVGAAALTMGLRSYLLIQIPVILLAGATGVWLFYVQHQFEGVYWARHDEWDPLDAAIKGSSHYRLPRILQWATGNIGLHHIHHVVPRIPNYNLQRCLDRTPALQLPHPLSLRESLGSLRLRLWDEEGGRLVGFKALRHAP